MATKLSLKLLIDKKAKKVLFAEANKDFVDFLLSLMCMPMGSVIKLLRSNEMVGCIGNIYQSVEKLSDACLQEMSCRDLVLSPQMASLPVGPKPPLLLNKVVKRQDFSTSPSQFVYSFSSAPRVSSSISSSSFSSPSFSAPCRFGGGGGDGGGGGGGEGGFVKGAVYMVKDDLEVTPMSTISSITLLSTLVQDLASLEEKTVEFGMEEGLSLLKASMRSNTALTDVFLPK